MRSAKVSRGVHRAIYLAYRVVTAIEGICTVGQSVTVVINPVSADSDLIRSCRRAGFNFYANPIFRASLPFTVRIAIAGSLVQVHGTIQLADRVVVAVVRIIAIDPAITIVVAAVIADFRFSNTAGRFEAAICNILTVSQIVTVIVDAIKTDFRDRLA